MRPQELFTTIRTEGGLLPTDLLQRIASNDSVKGLDPSDYHLAAGERLNEAISRSWTRLTTAWKNFRIALEKMPSSDPATSVTKEKWLLILFQELGYGRLVASKSVEIQGRSYSISNFWQNIPIHLVGYNVELDKRTANITGAARTSPHGLLQDFLNRSEPSLWGFVSNGSKLRVLRDNKSLTRQAYIEFDLQGLMNGEVFADFALLWLICHQSRVEADRPETCWLEKWMQAAQEQGTRALERLREGVERAINSLGAGFLSHVSNVSLREKLRTGTLTKQDYYRQLLRLVYRLLFLFVAEDRDLLLIPNTTPETRKNFQHYSTVRIRRLAQNRKGARHSDLYCGLRILMEKLSDTGCSALGLPALGSFLWSNSAIPDLEACEISNFDFLNAIRALALREHNRMLRPIDYKNLGSEELGSVYESLLELRPEIDSTGETFNLTSAVGHERKTTGSYYTPTSLIQCLLDSALDPVLDEACKKPDPATSILNLKVCDPACGSGHFLVAAAHRMAKRLASIRTGDVEPSPEALRTALRDVIGHCIYGVDINPMSVELCKISLWMEALEPGKPLSFLEHRIQCGNSLIGATPVLLKKGIPDEAFTALEGDDKVVCGKLKKRNKEERAGNRRLDFEEPWERLGDLTSSITTLDQIADDSIEGIQKKQQKYEELIRSTSYEFGRLYADSWCSAFVWKKSSDSGLPDCITEDVFREIEKSPFSIASQMRDEIKRLSQQYQFFHWHLAFPRVFLFPFKEELVASEQTGWSGGFDVVLGNPPWERLKIQEKEWFAERRPEIAEAPNAAARRKMIAVLKTEDSNLYKIFLEDQRKADGESLFVRESGRYPLCGRGDVNTYSIFAELNWTIVNAGGRVGCIVPSGIATDDTTKFFFQEVIVKKSLFSFYDFENREKIFPTIDSRIKFSLLTLTGSSRPVTGDTQFVFFAHNVSDLVNQERRFTLNAKDIELLNPNTRTSPIFRSMADARITLHIYRKNSILSSDSHNNAWGAFYMRLVDLGDHKDHIRFPWEERASECDTVLYESKLINAFDHRFATFDGVNRESYYAGHPREITEPEKEDPNFFITPRYYVENALVTELFSKYPNHPRDWILVWRDISRATDERTSIASIIPRTIATRSCPGLGISKSEDAFLLLGILNSFCCDYIVRQKVGGVHFNWQILAQIAVLDPSCLDSQMRELIRKHVVELTYTAWDLKEFARDNGWNGSPFLWNKDRRFLLRCELDAAFFLLYLSTEANGDWSLTKTESAEHLARLKAHFPTPREAVNYIMETFSIVKRKDIEKYGEYRTKKTILQIYDSMVNAIRMCKPYQTLLDPPPADPRLCHQEKIRSH